MRKIRAYAKISTKEEFLVQDGENPVGSGAAGTPASSAKASKTGFKLDFSPEAMQLKQKAAEYAKAANVPSAPAPKIEAAEEKVSDNKAPEQKTAPEAGVDPELAAAQADFASEPQLSGEVDMEQLIATENAEAGKPTELISSEPEEPAVAVAEGIENNAETAPAVSSSNIAQKQSPNPKIVALICVLGILVVISIVLVVLHFISKNTPKPDESSSVETVVEEQPKTSSSRRRIIKKPVEEEPAEDQPAEQEQQPAVEEPPVEETPEVDPNILQIDISEANTRIKIPMNGNFIDYRKVGNKITFWAATKRDDKNFEVRAEDNCATSGDEAAATNCEAQLPEAPEFADKMLNTKGMATITWWRAANPDSGITVFESSPWYIMYSTGSQSTYSTDEQNGIWESESTMYLYDLLTNPEIYSQIDPEVKE